MNNFGKLICLILFLIQPGLAITQIVYDKYFEFETSDEKTCKTIDLDGQGVLIIELSIDETLNQTKANYKILDNGLNERFAIDATYKSALLLNSIHVDSASVCVFYANTLGSCIFEKIDLGQGTNSQINIDLDKKGEIVKADFSNEKLYIIRSH